MLSSGSLAAPSKCLRCQLRQVIFSTRSRPRAECLPPKHRPFTTSIRHREEFEEDGTVHDDNERGSTRAELYRRKYPLGRVVGRPGRRQREGSARLNINALSKPFDVVVLDDIVEPKNESHAAEIGPVEGVNGSQEITAADIANGISGQGEMTEAEAHESINSLRPDTHLLDREDYKELAQKLSRSYSNLQLSSYLTQALQLGSIEGDTVHISRAGSTSNATTWRPGRTPLNKRHSNSTTIKKSEIGKNKTKLVEQVLRLAWSLALHSEAQEIGEVEILWEPWQITYLFDRLSNGIPKAENYLESDLLRRSVDIRPYRPHNIMRITGRRGDAEDAAAQILSHMQHSRRLTLDLSIFEPLLGQPGWPAAIGEVLNVSDLDEIGRRTVTVIERTDDRTIDIYGPHDRAPQLARRLLLQMLELPSLASTRNSTLMTTPSEDVDADQNRLQMLLPESAGSNLHFKYRKIALGRLASPTMRAQDIESKEDVHASDDSGLKYSNQVKLAHSTQARALVDELYNIPAETFPTPIEKKDSESLTSSSDEQQSYWVGASNPEKAVPCEIQLCRILQPIEESTSLGLDTDTKSRKDKHQNESQRSILHSRVPGMETLLSYFKPLSSKSKPDLAFLVAHYIPSPLQELGIEAMRTLPRIEIRCDIIPGSTKVFKDKRDNNRTDRGFVKFKSAAAMISPQRILQLPMPHESADLLIQQRTQMYARPIQFKADEEIDRFLRTLEASAAQVRSELKGEDIIRIKLPRWIATPGENQASQEEVEVEYMFERFEQVQSVDLVPIQRDEVPKGASIDPDLQQILDHMPTNSSLCYREVEGGFLGGSRSELSLQNSTLENFLEGSEDLGDEENRPQEAAVRRIDTELVETALGLVRSLTRINAGEIKPLRFPRWDTVFDR